MRQWLQQYLEETYRIFDEIFAAIPTKTNPAARQNIHAKTILAATFPRAVQVLQTASSTLQQRMLSAAV